MSQNQITESITATLIRLLLWVFSHVSLYHNFWAFEIYLHKYLQIHFWSHILNLPWCIYVKGICSSVQIKEQKYSGAVCFCISSCCFVCVAISIYLHCCISWTPKYIYWLQTASFHGITKMKRSPVIPLRVSSQKVTLV